MKRWRKPPLFGLNNNLSYLNGLHCINIKEIGMDIVDALKKNFTSLPNEQICTGVIMLGSAFGYIGYRYDYDQGYGAFLIFGYFENIIKRVRVNNGEWTVLD